LIRNLTVPRPFFRDAKCIRCGQCVAICPASALCLEDSPRARAPEGLDQGKRAKRIRVDYEKCLRCYCCHEVCPVDAIAIKRRF
jgi:formate hydrogenlyase subunit 6/NADH:ubiquinone oxidoreductase subunit I